MGKDQMMWMHGSPRRLTFRVSILPRAVAPSSPMAPFPSSMRTLRGHSPSERKRASMSAAESFRPLLAIVILPMPWLETMPQSSSTSRGPSCRGQGSGWSQNDNKDMHILRLHTSHALSSISSTESMFFRAAFNRGIKCTFMFSNVNLFGFWSLRDSVMSVSPLILKLSPSIHGSPSRSSISNSGSYVLSVERPLNSESGAAHSLCAQSPMHGFISHGISCLTSLSSMCVPWINKESIINWDPLECEQFVSLANAPSDRTFRSFPQLRGKWSTCLE